MIGRKVTRLAVAALATVALSMGPAAAGHKASGRYIGGMPAGGGFLPHSGPSYTLAGPSVGGVWFEVPAWATSLAASVRDDYSDVVAADVLFVIDEYGPLGTSKRFCGSSSGIPIPSGTKALYVRVVDLGSLKCSPPGVPTTGVIDVTFG
jgi:hypothetical protein